MKVDLTESELKVIRHLLRDANGGWGEPFKDFEDDDIDPDKTVTRLLRKLATKEK